MPPTLVIEDGSGKSNSNSYNTAADFDAYMERIPDSYKATYLPIGIFIKEQLSIWATQLINNNIVWPDYSYRYTSAQSLDFPRIGIYSPDGAYLLNERTIPQFIHDATAQLSFELLKSDLTAEPARGLRGLTVGPIQINFDTDHAHDVKIIPRSVSSMLASYGGVLRGSQRVYTIPLYRS